jgi:glycosyltransferase involved in cell wall biosynthesis
MKLSVIIPCYNGADTITTQLDALSTQSWSETWEVIVSDNGSTDGTSAVVERYRERLPNLRIVDASHKRGQPYALNAGVRAARSEAVAFCDADDEVAPGWVAAMGEALSRHDFVAGCFEMEKLNPRWMKSSHHQEVGLNTYRYPPYLPHAGSGNMGVRRSVHAALGGFDESMPYLFDTDFCFRAQLAETRLHFAPDAVLHYRAPADMSTIYRKALLNGQYNVLLYKRYRPLGMPKLSLRRGLSEWLHVLSGIATLRDRNNIAHWTWSFAWRLGRLKGCLKYRTLAL